MFDFRYHALSLVAVFLALAIGILLGATIGDSLVSEAGKGLSSSLHQDVVNARNEARQANSQLHQRDDVISSVLPMVVQNELAGQRVAIIGTGNLPSSIESEVRQTVEVAGGNVDSVSVFDVPNRLADLEQAAGGDGSVAAERPDLVEAFRLHKSLPDLMRGDFRGVGSVAFYRAAPPDDETDAQKTAREAFEKGLAEGLQAQGVQTVGVEEQGTDPSQVGWYKDRKMSTVDSVDLPGGQIALVFTLAGEKGNYGIKGGAAPLPKLPIGAGGG
jgi:copper transport outer membrane protein MctB